MAEARAYAVHRLPGRVRFKIPARRADHPFFGELERRLRRLGAVTDVSINPTTGSVLVEHKGEIAELVKEAVGSDIGELVEIVLGMPPVARRVRAELTTLDQAVQRFSGGAIDLGTFAAIGLLAMAGVYLWRGRPPASAVSLGWYASELLRRSGGGEHHPASARAG